MIHVERDDDRDPVRDHYWVNRAFWVRLSEPRAAPPLREGLSVIERILTRSVPAANGCLEWQGATGKGKNGRKGHGRIKVNGRLELPHRLVLEHALGTKLSRDVLACHEWDNPICVERTHLFPSSYAGNAKDAVRKGRMKTPRNGDAVAASNTRRRDKGYAGERRAMAADDISKNRRVRKDKKGRPA